MRATPAASMSFHTDIEVVINAAVSASADAASVASDPIGHAHRP